MVIIEEKSEEEAPNHSKGYVNIRPIPAHSEPLPSSSNQPPFRERLVLEKVDPTPKFDMASNWETLEPHVQVQLHTVKGWKLINSSHRVLNLVKYELTVSVPWERRAISFCSSNCLGVLPCESLSLRSIHKSLAVLMYITLALRSMLRELVSHESTVCLLYTSPSPRD